MVKGMLVVFCILFLRLLHRFVFVVQVPLGGIKSMHRIALLFHVGAV